MNSFLEKLFHIIAIDTEYLNSYLTLDERQYLNNTLKSIEDLEGDFYTDTKGQNLEMLLHFLFSHKKDITNIWENPSKKEILLKLYTSSAISGNYECFRFDLSKFDKTYKSSGQILTLYRIGRKNEHKESLGNSWSKSINGLKNYIQASSIQEVENRPIFVIKIYDSEILSEGKPIEEELILKKDFKVNEFRTLDIEERRQIFM